MSETRMAGRAISDIASACRHTRPVSTARWLISFGNSGDAAAKVGRFRQHGFAIDLRDNAGIPVPVTSERLDCAYFRRS
jgi:hypothetical protein